MSPLLELRRLEAGYPTAQVLFGVDLEVGRGEVVALLGRNGMGKTTLIRSVFGLTALMGGSILLEGRRVSGLPPEEVAALGVALVPEGRQIFPNLTVWEHLAAFFRRPQGRRGVWTPERVLELFPRLRERVGSWGSRLSGGEQQMLAIGRALVTNPRLLLMDEATEGLAPLLREEIWRALAALKEEGLSVLVVDKHVRRLAEIADRFAILEKGRVVWQGRPQEALADPQLLKRYLGV
ncbi:MAG: ABC transporter ATP-binding protein [Thermus sp.]|uniref:ABC transporter ATP-binding protein n=1 Tax=Thermus sp. TaxID=275 RepID=UPI00298EFA1A|nr:ABC transporter ATP-binding protein [Thermus sp.]MDW8018219.1 ABC transporter ATP-binding protein [Thermus sp.]MDW8357914.1 ABC transporter ATP-binding protein [Thermus sp.]